MPESILIQVGQCGNQIGNRFWDLALREHAKYNRLGVYDESMSTFFRNVDVRYEPARNLPLGDGNQRIQALRARGVLVDMEEGVIGQVEKGPLAELFEPGQKITSQSGCGNNWAVGHNYYGPQYQERILEAIRKQAEHCDALQSFFLCHSMGGGTGSGLGTYILGLLEDEYPDAYRFCNVVFPSPEEDDVITSPYNSMLALNKLTEHADCVLPIENQALMDIHNRINAVSSSSAIKKGSEIDNAITPKNKKQKAFDTMNAIVANVMLNMTSSMRFEGTLNIDINEISMNLVPFPRLKYLISSLTPLYQLADVKMPQRKLDQMFSDAFSRECQLLKADPRNGTYLACALLVRGEVDLSDIRRNVERMKKQLKFIPWNQEGWKTGHCSVPPVGQPYSLLTLANNCCISDTFGVLQKSFLKLYKRKAHLHHYTKDGLIDEQQFDASLDSLKSLTAEYQSWNQL